MFYYSGPVHFFCLLQQTKKVSKATAQTNNRSRPREILSICLFFKFLLVITDRLCLIENSKKKKTTENEEAYSFFQENNNKITDLGIGISNRYERSASYRLTFSSSFCF